MQMSFADAEYAGERNQTARNVTANRPHSRGERYLRALCGCSSLYGFEHDVTDAVTAVAIRRGEWCPVFHAACSITLRADFSCRRWSVWSTHSREQPWPPPNTWRRIDNNRGIAMALVQGELVQRQVGGSDSSPVPAAFGSAGLHPAP